jgi:hypothetical protein
LEKNSPSAQLPADMTKPSRQAPMGIFRYIRGHWRGSLSLPKSFWVNGLVTTLVVGVLTTFAVDAIYKSDLKDGAWAFSTLAIFGLCVIIAAWAVIGILRSSTNYLQQGGRVALGVAAMVFMLIGILCLILQISKTSPAVLESALLQVGIDPLGAPATLTVTGRELHIDGHLTINLAEAFTALINKHPDVNQISITSPGGRIDTAFQIASIISERKLNTVVVGKCSSACTIIFLSGKARILDVDSTLGFHSPSVLGLSDIEARFRSPEVTDVYEAAGLSEAFISQALRTPSAKMWYPSDDVLIRQGAVHLFTQVRLRQEHEREVEYFRTKGPLKIDKLTKVVGAKIDNTALTYTYVIAARADEIDWDGMVVMAKYDANAAICRNAVTYLMVKSGATYTYLYVDKNGEKVGSVVIEKCYNTL